MPGSLVIKLAIEPISQFYISGQDLTLPYSPVNTTGWLYEPTYILGPNPFIKNVNTAIWAVTMPSKVQWIIDALTPGKRLYDVVNGLIQNPYIFKNTQFGLVATDPFPDGLYEFELQVTGSYPSDPVYNFNANPTARIYMTKTAECCVAKLSEKVAEKELKCCDAQYQQWLQAEVYLAGIIENAKCKKYEEADKILALLQALCKETGCGCGCK